MIIHAEIHEDLEGSESRSKVMDSFQKGRKILRGVEWWNKLSFVLTWLQILTYVKEGHNLMFKGIIDTCLTGDLEIKTFNNEILKFELIHQGRNTISLSKRLDAHS